MMRPPNQIRDPFGLTVLLAATFAALAFIRLRVPSAPYFDEVHYLPAARALLDQSAWLNREHPLLGKELMALSIGVVGDTPLGWRILSLAAGTLTLFALCRTVWFTTCSRFASMAAGVLLSTGFALFIQSRIAMLDVFMACFTAVALWQVAGAMREPEAGRKRLAIAGVALGLAMASKWNAVPLAVIPGLGFLLLRAMAGRRRLVTSRRGMPVPGITLAEAAVWLGLVPLAVYWLTFLPVYFVADQPLPIGGFLALHQQIEALQASVTKSHPYQSCWYDWMLNIRAIWYLYEPVDGAQRGIMLIGNPLTMLLGLPAMAWCAWAGITARRWDALAIFVFFAASMVFWMVADKPVQFYYHYLLPGCFLLGGLALALDEFWKRGIRWLPLAVLAGSIALFIWFYPIMSAAPLSGVSAFEKWMWLPSWR
ncbi:phospholipid carrier-dependent glycosyltransferase [Altererythrobacter confluentis]|uniref:Polyprenol-phosphate-mannose--protein mannosyltransferase n=1 Tax=Allopontixanthobacter confluentis TaxID=1849021 RepID=A0A6L7GFN2_9SPHN|nr:glycosyltransferase family 39 protein [Allopontixanthobacter confluentis]MXP14480.1 phospholipid carrier-dependent glycosyltransferase [Allopontixanthobacter confluentis]